jgi:hypothetical protein
MEEHFDRTAGVHHAVTLRDLIEQQGQVEDLSRVDLPVPHEVNERGQVRVPREIVPSRLLYAVLSNHGQEPRDLQRL